MATTIAALLAALLSGINIGVFLHKTWKGWRTLPPPHPLQPVLIDIARAIRERA